MMMPGRVVALVLSLAASAQVLVADDAERARKWAEKLQDARTPQRLKAVQELRKLGGAAGPAVPGLLTAAKDADPLVRTEALAALGGLMDGLVRVARTHVDPAVRAEAVARIRGDATLDEVVRSAPPDTARVAFQRIKGTTFVAALARSGPAEIRPLAAGNLSDPAMLTELARTGGEDVRGVAIGRLEDPARLGELAREADPSLAAVATGRLLVLAGTVPPAARAGVIAQIGDRSALLSLARNGPAEAARALAESSEDAEVLAALAAHPDPVIAVTAASRSSDPRVVDAGAAHSDETVRLAVLRRVSDVKRIAAAARGDASPRVRLAMAARLTGTETLTSLSRADANPTVRRLAAFLLLQADRGKKPVIALWTVKSDRLQDLVRRKTPALLAQRALLFECASEQECALFPSRAVAQVSVTDSNQCFQNFYISGPCSNPGKDVTVRYGFFRDDKEIGGTAFRSRTPESVAYKVTTYGGVVVSDLGPTADDVWRSTEKSAREAAAGWSLSEPTVKLDRLLAF
jgi:hypothetical protein